MVAYYLTNLKSI